jgi:hypothetical protein
MTAATTAGPDGGCADESRAEEKRADGVEVGAVDWTGDADSRDVGPEDAVAPVAGSMGPDSAGFSSPNAADAADPPEAHSGVTNDGDAAHAGRHVASASRVRPNSAPISARPIPTANGSRAHSLTPEVDRFDGFQPPAGYAPQTEALAARLDRKAGAIRLGSPAEVVAAVPYFFGFHPENSLVLLGLSRSHEDGRAAISHGLRADLAEVTRNPAAFGRWAAGRLLDCAANEAIVLVYPASGALARIADYRRLVAGLCAPLRTAGVPPLDVLFISGGRWWSFLCDQPRCCPPEGTAVDTTSSVIAALSAYSGLAVLPNREALAVSLEPYGELMIERIRESCDAALRRMAEEQETAGIRKGRSRVWSRSHGSEAGVEPSWSDIEYAWCLADSLCDGQVLPDRALADDVAGELLVCLADVRFRDYLATWCGDDRAGQAVALGVELARRSVTAEQAAAAYSIAAWAAWALGWGAWCRLCVDRATSAVPGYALASLIKEGLDRGVDPEMVREAARGTARRLAEMRPDRASGRVA